MFSKVFKTFLALILLIGLLPFSAPAEAASKNLKVHFINVGQGDSALIQTPNGKNYLIDGGKKGQGKVVTAYLKKNGVKKLDAVIATHPDADHIGGLITVINSFKVSAVYAPKVSHTSQTYKDFLKAVKSKKLTIKTAKKGVKINTGTSAVSLSFIAPVKSYGKDLNNWSAVLLLKHNQKKFLFMGDAETQAENDMISQKVLSKVDVLKVGHHGAKNTTSTAFLKKVSPKYAVISVGKNSYGHPTSEVWNRLKARKMTIYRTDKSKNIVFTSTGKKITVKTVK
ncbi:ComEC/Rec2 family competence protein [Pradoshia sp.]